MTKHYSRREMSGLLLRSLPAAATLGLMSPGRSQGLTAPNYYDTIITYGFAYGIRDPNYSYFRQPPGIGSPAIYPGFWLNCCNAFVGVIQQMRWWRPLDGLADRAFANPSMIPSAGDIQQFANLMVGTNFSDPPTAAQYAGDLTNYFNATIGQEGTIQQQVQSVGYADMYNGFTSLLAYYEQLNPDTLNGSVSSRRKQGVTPNSTCDFNPDPCYYEPFLDPYNPACIAANPPDEPYPWFWPGQGTEFLPQPKPNMTKQEICFYATWFVRYASLVLRVLVTSGGALAAPEISVPLGTVVLLANVGLWIAC